MQHFLAVLLFLAAALNIMRLWTNSLKFIWCPSDSSIVLRTKNLDRKQRQTRGFQRPLLIGWICGGDSTCNKLHWPVLVHLPFKSLSRVDLSVLLHQRMKNQRASLHRLPQYPSEQNKNRHHLFLSGNQFPLREILIEIIKSSSFRAQSVWRWHIRQICGLHWYSALIPVDFLPFLPLLVSSGS